MSWLRHRRISKTCASYSIEDQVLQIFDRKVIPPRRKKKVKTIISNINSNTVEECKCEQLKQVKQECEHEHGMQQSTSTTSNTLTGDYQNAFQIESLKDDLDLSKPLKQNHLFHSDIMSKGIPLKNTKSVLKDSSNILKKTSASNIKKDFKSIRKNIYKDDPDRCHSTVYENPVCYCIYIEGESGCNEECINRMSHYECSPGTCPLKERCTNQRFQKRSYKKLVPRKCGNKGMGLFAKEDIKNDDFLLEYVGEVISKSEAENRLGEAKLHDHFYILSLNHREYVDAYKMGNISRYINHSCDPNCVTSKWTVDGRPRVGIFAIKDIKKGEEVTFDYNMENFGIKRQACYCGALKCRGVIEAQQKSQNRDLSYGTSLKNSACSTSSNNNSNGSNITRNIFDKSELKANSEVKSSLGETKKRKISKTAKSRQSKSKSKHARKQSLHVDKKRTMQNRTVILGDDLEKFRDKQIRLLSDDIPAEIIRCSSLFLLRNTRRRKTEISSLVFGDSEKETNPVKSL